jgi:hypothetical protein
VNIIEAIADRRYLRPAFRDLSTWRAWFVYLRALYGLGIDDPDDLRLFRECTELEAAPTEPARESYCICGRRSGKTFLSAVIAIYQACFMDWQPFLARGEKAYIHLVATDRLQAGQIKDYISGILRGSPALKGLVKAELKESIELSNRVVIRVSTASLRALRGYGSPAGVLDEFSFFRDSETSANPSAEIITALRPALASFPGSCLLGISSPYSRSGVLWDAYRRYFGQAGGPLIWKAASLTMNPTLDPGLIARAIAEDPQGGRSEWQAEFREDISAFLPTEAVERCVVSGRVEVPPISGMDFFAHIDPSGGRQDSMTVAVTFREKNGKVVLAAVREARPPFNPAEVCREFSAFLKTYRLHSASSDRYAGEWVVAGFAKEGITITPAALTCSEGYLEFLPLIQSGRVELIDNRRLIGQLAGLERRVRSGGRDLVDHIPGTHDDLAAAVAAACVKAGEEGKGAAIGTVNYSVYPDDHELGGEWEGAGDSVERAHRRAFEKELQETRKPYLEALARHRRGR